MRRVWHKALMRLIGERYPGQMRKLLFMERLPSIEVRNEERRRKNSISKRKASSKRGDMLY